MNEKKRRALLICRKLLQDQLATYNFLLEILADKKDFKKKFISPATKELSQIEKELKAIEKSDGPIKPKDQKLVDACFKTMEDMPI